MTSNNASGAGLIVKSSEVDPATGERHHLVQGITTAGAIWMSSAVGLACGGGLYFVACFATALNLVLLRFGPRPTSSSSDDSSVAGSYGSLIGRDVIAMNRHHGKVADLEAGNVSRLPSPDKQAYGSTAQERESLNKDEERLEPLRSPSSNTPRMRSKKSRPSLL
jgi:putative Mg2+ transporter-C (MgtC) family protein